MINQKYAISLTGLAMGLVAVGILAKKALTKGDEEPGDQKEIEADKKVLDPGEKGLSDDEIFRAKARENGKKGGRPPKKRVPAKKAVKPDPKPAPTPDPAPDPEPSNK